MGRVDRKGAGIRGYRAAERGEEAGSEKARSEKAESGREAKRREAKRGQTDLEMVF